MPIQVLMPALSPTMTEGKLATWLKKEGEAVNSGDVIAEIETDKATMEVEAVEEGTMGRILVPEGTEGVAVNTPIALLLEDGEDESALSGFSAAAPAAQPSAPAAPAEPAAPAAAASPAPAAAPAPAATNGAAGRVFASPLARRMASQAGLDLATINGSGPRGRVVKRDIEAALAGGVPAAAAPAAAPAPGPAPAAAQPFEPAFELEPHTTMRRTIARRLSESKRDIPHFYLSVDCELDALLQMRKQLNDQAPEGTKLSVNDLIIKVVALGLRRVPAANASWSDEGIKLYQSIDVAVAVATEGGLITPVIRSADAKGLATISSEMKELAGRAREGKLMPEDYSGGTFTISNLGMFEIRDFSAVINPPQACILAVGAGDQRPVVKDGALAVATVMSCTLSVDHRAVDGAIGAQFLQAFKELVEAPLSMML